MLTKNNIEIVLIGGSAGSIPIVLDICEKLPAQINYSIVIVLHRLKNAPSLLSELLKNKSKIKTIKEVEEKESIKSGYIYIAPTNYHLLIEEDKTFSLDSSELIHYSRPAIDVTFETGAMVYQHQCAGILLSGANYDGTEGMLKIKEKGGLTIIQDPTTAESASMPRNAQKELNIKEVYNTAQIVDFLNSIK